jgi:RHS repeat-associated protein
MQHDASGNLKTKGQTTYQWDVRDRLVGISGSGVTASFSYDALGRRASKTVNGQTLGYQYDGADIIQDSGSQYLQGVGIDDVLSRTTNGNSEYYLKDHLGSAVALTDQSGNLATQYAYSPYGQVSKTGTSSNNYFTYTGREDDSTGLYYYRARYYSPDLKRFTAEDPIGFSGGQSNLYGYVGGNPTSASDPLGLHDMRFPTNGAVVNLSDKPVLVLTNNEYERLPPNTQTPNEYMNSKDVDGAWVKEGQKWEFYPVATPKVLGLQFKKPPTLIITNHGVYEHVMNCHSGDTLVKPWAGIPDTNNSPTSRGSNEKDRDLRPNPNGNYKDASKWEPVDPLDRAAIDYWRNGPERSRTK